VTGRPDGFGPLSWLWWPVAVVGWALAAVAIALEWVWQAPGRAVGPRNGPGGLMPTDRPGLPRERPAPAPLRDELTPTVKMELMIECAILVIVLAVLLAVLVVLAGCASTTVTCTDLTHGACTVSSTRLLTDSGVTLTDPKTGLSFDFTSKPDQAGTQAAINALAAVITVLVPAKPAAAPIVTPSAGYGLPDHRTTQP
jgi:hypothetical protein